MLFDPKWEKPEVKADPFSLESLIAWLEKQPADRTYDFCQPSSCLIAEYLKARGEKNIILLSNEVDALGWTAIVHPRPTNKSGWTYGKALTRARSLLADQRKFETASAVGS